MAEVVHQGDNLRGRFPALLRSAETCRNAVTSSQHDASSTFSAADKESAASANALSPLQIGQSARMAGTAGASGSDAQVRDASVCVEELLYRQALCMGREAAVDELLGQYESSATLCADSNPANDYFTAMVSASMIEAVFLDSPNR